MDRKLASIIALLIILIGTAPATISAEISVGVKQGDWIEYQVTFTGTPDPGHDVTWARMEVVDVQGKDISLAITTKFSNGTLLNETITLNLETGQLGDDFIIPANLKSGDMFFDKRQGNMTISGVEERTYAGATRTIVSGTTSQTTYYWDKATGILVEGNSSFTDFTMNTKVDKTNMWQAQIVLGAIGDKTVNELVTLTFTATATDDDVPSNTLTYSLVGAPAGASINPSTGAFSWTPTEAQGPGVYTFTVKVTDNGSPSLSDEEEITVTVNEVNVAPFGLDPTVFYALAIAAVAILVVIAFFFVRRKK